MRANRNAHASRGSARDRELSLVHRALTQVTASKNASLLSETATLTEAASLRVTYADGQEYAQPPAEGGYAMARRLPATRVSLEQLEFVVYAHRLGESSGNKLLPQEAMKLMQKVGTTACAAEYNYPASGYAMPHARV